MRRKHDQAFGGMVDLRRSRNVSMTNSRITKCVILDATTDTSYKVVTSTNNISTTNAVYRARPMSRPMELRISLVDVIHTNLLTVEQRRALAAKRIIKKEVEWKQDLTIPSAESIVDESCLNQSTPKGAKKDFKSIQSIKHEVKPLPKARKRKFFGIKKRSKKKVKKEDTKKILSLSPFKEVERKVFEVYKEDIPADDSSTHSSCVQISGENRNKEKSQRNNHKKPKTTNEENRVTFPRLQTFVKEKGRKNGKNAATSREANRSNKKVHINTPSKIEISSSNKSQYPLKVYNNLIDQSKKSGGGKARENLPGHTSNRSSKLKNPFYQAHIPSTMENTHDVTDIKHREINFRSHDNDDLESQSSYSLLPLSDSPFCKIHIENSPSLDNEHSSFESIGRAIDNDMATGNRLSLPADCNVLTSSVDPLSLPDILEVNRCDNKHRGDKSIKSPKTILSVQDTSFESSGSTTRPDTGKRKCPEIINDDLLPKGTIAIPSVQSVSHVDKKQRKILENDNGVADANYGEFFNNELLNSIQNGDTYPTITTFLNENNFTTKNNGTTAAYEDTLNNNLRDRFIDENARNNTTANDLLVTCPFVAATETTAPHFLEKLKVSSGSSTVDDSAKRRIDESVAPSFAIHQSKELSNAERFKNTKNTRVTKVEELTKANLHRFNVITTVNKSVNEGVIEKTPIRNLSKKMQLEHGDSIANGNSVDTPRVRKRKWLVSNKDGTSSTGASRGKIKLNRKWKCKENRFLERDVDFEVSARTSQTPEFHKERYQPLNYQVKTNIRDRPNKNEDEINYSRDFVEKSNDFEKLNSSARTVQNCRITNNQGLPAFGASNSCNIESTMANQTDDEDVSESSESSTSSSSSVSICSRTSASASSDEKSKDEIPLILDEYSTTSSHCSSGIIDETTEKIEVPGTTEELKDSITMEKVLAPMAIKERKNATALKELKAPATITDINGLKKTDIKCLRNKEKIKDPTKADEIERLTRKKEIHASEAAIRMEPPVGTKEKKGVFEEKEIDSIARDDDEFEDLVGTDEFDIGNSLKEIEDRREPENSLDKATCPTENADCTNGVNESDEEDCISLFAESLCMTRRFASPPLQELPEPCRLPNRIEQYTNMKADNIDRFVTANEHECTATFEEYKDNATKPGINFESPSVDRPLKALMKVPNNMESKVDDKLDLRTTLNNRTNIRDIPALFRGHCFGWLKGFCNIPQCRYRHSLKREFRKIELLDQKYIEGIITYAINNRYQKFLELIESKAIMNMPVEKIIAICNQLYRMSLFSHFHMEVMVAALGERGLSQEAIIFSFRAIFEQYDTYTQNQMMHAVYRYFESDNGRKILGNKSLSANDTSARLEMREVVKVADCSYELASPASPRPEDGLPANETVDVTNVFTKKTSQSYTIKRGATERSKEGCFESLSAPLVAADESYHLRPIDRVPPPKSLYGNSLWKFHLDLAGVQEGLKYRDYAHVICILNEYSKFPNRLPHIAGFYDILCAEIMLSKHHWSEILRLTVHLRSSDELYQYVYDLGIYVLTKLADTGVWIHAYDLLKVFRVYGTYNTCAFTLLAAEIYIANQRPLKALAILKESRIIFGNTRVWQHRQCPGDKNLRVSVINLLLQSLCYGYAEHALALLEFIIFDQASSFQPINVCRHVDTIARCILSEKQTSLVQDLSRLILEAQLSVSTATFRALINRVFHDDPILAKQLHRYATWLGSYNTAKINGASCVHMIINADWTEEETYLMVSSLIDDLYMNIGHAVGRLKARQLNVFLVIEKIPSERQLAMDTVNKPTTNAEINKQRNMVQSVLERFDPKIKILRKSSGKICKLQSASLVEYLKSGQLRR